MSDFQTLIHNPDAWKLVSWMVQGVIWGWVVRWSYRMHLRVKKLERRERD